MILTRENWELRNAEIFVLIVQMQVYQRRSFALDSVAAVHKAPKYGV